MYLATWQIFAGWCFLLSYNCISGQLWKFATSNSYTNLRILADGSQFYSSLNIPKDLSLTLARLHCGKYCTDNYECLAFNLYENVDFYVCELVPDNLCIGRTNKVFIAQDRGAIWDKLGPEGTKACIETLAIAGQGILCKYLRPGCSGTWPNCSDCTKTCIECFNRQLQRCVMWPDGDGLDSLPIMGRCAQDNTVLMARQVNLITGKILRSYRMALHDMHRISRLKAYPIIKFYFNSGLEERFARYRNWSIDTNGTLQNLVSVSLATSQLGIDIFSLKGQALSPVPFVEVIDDRFGCGSFWLLDSSNATYCPGGKTSLFGKPRFDGIKVISTGIRCAKCNFFGPIEFGSVELAN